MHKIQVALVGNPNSGKTSVFNNLTGSRQHVGNWPGVTVEKKEGKFFYEDAEVSVVDLPGMYGLTAYSLDEKIARHFLLGHTSNVIVTVVDAGNLERNLYLVTQLLELGLKVVIDLNMIDVARNKGILIDNAKLSQIFQVPVVETIANRKKGTEDLRKAILQAERAEKGIPLIIDYGEDIEREINAIANLFKNKTVPEEYPPRWIALKLLEGDEEVKKEFKDILDEPLLSAVSTSVAKLQKHIGYELETAVAEKRYGFLEGLIRECCSREIDLKRRLEISDKIDAVITNKYLGIPIFLVIIWLMFQLVFAVGTPLADWIGLFFHWIAGQVSAGLMALNAPEWTSSLIADGIIGGVGSVLVFLPNILLLFLVITILEDSGYMSRAAFVMDRLMHTMGLHGKSFIPMILGFGCNVPAIMATRTLASRKDRILTILVNPLMSCSARLPIYVLFTAAFFPRHQGLVVFSLYVLGIVLAIVMAKVFKEIFFKHEVAPLIMELPPYRLPQLKSVVFHMWERAGLFVKKAGTIILLAVVIIWILSYFPTGAVYASKDSYIGKIGTFIAPVFKPAGFGFWQAAVSLVSGVAAKEVVVGTLGTLYQEEEPGEAEGEGQPPQHSGSAEGTTLQSALRRDFKPLSALSFMVMSLLYIPCVASIAAIRRETNWKWTAFAIAYTTALGWSVAVAVYQIGRLFVQ